ncbi:MAG: lytic transglycosylase domain-containing protein, partial [Syntrophomonas sp.]
MKKSKKKRFPVGLWTIILLFMLAVLSFPQWICYFYPQPNHDTVFKIAYENNVDPYLVFAIMRAESKYEPGARSSAGARGLMQIMPETAAWIAQQKGISDFKADQLHDPELNISFGCWYLASLNQEFEGRLPLIVAAYNAGRGNVKEWVVQDKWNGDARQLEKIPYEETRQYVKNVLKNYEAYRAIYM